MKAARDLVIAVVACTPVLLVAAPTTAVAEPAGAGRTSIAGHSWTMGGRDLANTRSNPLERVLTPASVSDLQLAWTSTTSGDVSATPAVANGALYVPDWGGSFWKVDARTGQVIWSRRVADYVGIAGAVSRASPAIVGHTVYLGTQQGAYLLAIDTATGDLRWKSQLDTHPDALLSQSPIVWNGVVYVGISSREEISAIDPSYPCCTFRGSLVAVDAATGTIRWKTYTIREQTPGPGGARDIFSGGGVWGGTPTIDPASGTVYVGTGNNYRMPTSAQQCQQAGGTAAECLPEWNHINSILALDARTGAIKWATGQNRFDAWNGGCIRVPPDNCPLLPGPDFDFADGTHLVTLPSKDGHPRLGVTAGQKSGEYWMLDARTGAVIWRAVTGPGSFIGGIQYGSATDGRRIYFTQTNANRTAYTLADGRTIDYSSFGAIDVATGQILWQTPEPSGQISAGTVSTASGVVYVVSLTGVMYALDGATGRQLWQFQGAASSVAGPAIVDGTVYWGNGYARIRTPGTSSTTFYAFRRP